MQTQMETITRTLELEPHPEGGYFRETFRSAIGCEPGPAKSVRPVSTAIYFLLRSGSFSALHRIIGSDEVWHHYDGDPVELHQLSEGLGHQVQILGKDLASGQRPQIVVPAGTFQAAVTIGDGYTLCGCTVSPGFRFEDFEMPGRSELLQQYPLYADVITRFTRT